MTSNTLWDRYMKNKVHHEAFIKHLSKYIDEGYSLGLSRYKAAMDAGIKRSEIWGYARGSEYAEIKERFTKKYIHDKKWVK